MTIHISSYCTNGLKHLLSNAFSVALALSVTKSPCQNNILLEMRNSYRGSPHLGRRPVVAERGRQGTEREGGKKNGGVEGIIAGGLCASLPVCINQRAAHGCNEVENKKKHKNVQVK